MPFVPLAADLEDVTLRGRTHAQIVFWEGHFADIKYGQLSGERRSIPPARPPITRVTHVIVVWCFQDRTASRTRCRSSPEGRESGRCSP